MGDDVGFKLNGAPKHGWGAAALVLALVFVFATPFVFKMADVKLIFFALGILIAFCVIYLELASRRMIVKLDKRRFMPGEAISGTVTFKAGLDKKATLPKVYLRAYESDRGRLTTQLHEASAELKPISAIKPGKSFSFSIQPPPETLDYYEKPPPPKSKFERLERKIAPRRHPLWYLEIDLNSIASEFGITNKVPVHIISGKETSEELEAMDE